MNKTIKLILICLFIFVDKSYSQTITMQQSGTTKDLTGVHFFSATHGVACGLQTVLTTTDGGLNWVNRNNQANYTDVFMTDANTFYLTAANGLILKSIDGGINYTVLTTNTTSNLGSIFFINPQIGWASGQGGIMLKTDNGGQRWYKQQTTTQTFLNQVFFISLSIGWAVGAGDIIVKTIDAGTQWVPQTAGSTGLLNYQDVFFLNANEGWLTGYNGTNSAIYKTTNGGTTWNISTYASGNPQSEIQFFDSNNGFGCFDVSQPGKNTIRKTSNGGNNWFAVNSPSSNTVMKSIHFLNPNLGFAVGDSGKIMKITTTTGLPFEKENLQFQIFPNPVSDLLTVEYQEDEPTTIRIIDILGKELFSVEKRNNTTKKEIIDMKIFKNGIYLIEINSNSKRGFKKLSVVHE